MAVQHLSRQRGFSLFGLIFVGGLIAVTAVVGMQVAPTVLEYQSVVKAVNKVASESGTVADIRRSFDKTASIDDIKSISGGDLDISKDGDKVVVEFAYERELHLAGPAYLTLKYAGRSK